MGKIDVSKEIVINATAERVWQVVAEQFPDIGTWASGVNWSKSHPDAAVPEGATVGGRICNVPGFGETDERITRFEPEARVLAYSVEADKIPRFVSNLLNTWRITPADDSSARVLSHITADARGLFGAVMGPMMNKQFTKALDSALEDLQVFVETGQISDHKQRQSEKAGT